MHIARRRLQLFEKLPTKSKIKEDDTHGKTNLFNSQHFLRTLRDDD